MLKDELKAFIMLSLFDKGVLKKEPGRAAAVPWSGAAEELTGMSVMHENVLTFEQWERLL